MTGAEALAAAVPRLAAAGVPDPARDARLLLAHALDLPPGRLTLVLPDAAPPAVLARFEAAVVARCARRPVSQITGRRAFWGRDFAVTADVLDPRPETETLVALALEAPFGRVLDLGTGTGCLLLTLLAERPAATGIGVDASEAACAVARRNAQALGVAGRAEIFRSDWFERVDGRFDLIVANPPYIAAGEIAALAPEVRDWEPRGALTDGGDGLQVYRAIAAGAPGCLAPGGRLILEIGPDQAAPVRGLLAAAGLRDARIHGDLDGRDRAICAGIAPRTRKIP